ncbi:MAG: NAD(P)/FAD-dependent oxidoreductase [Paludibacter sp.]|nr:NAD(P)/FAD-dependent oxidoreductase [Paludibacter sp.]
MKFDIVVVGGGLAGLTAAAYISRAGKSIALIERQMKTGGLVQTFHRDNVYFDGGLRSIENSGIVFPMLRDLGIEIDFVKSPVSIGIADDVLRLKDYNSLFEYEELLKKHFPENKEDVGKIILEIRKIMKYMDVLYGIDNPAFLDITKDKKYLLTVIFPWLFKFLVAIRKIKNLNEPVNQYLAKFTNNQKLIDNIAQHFFQATPTSFALSYFHLYLDYHYPIGGTAVLGQKLEEFIVKHGGEIKTSTTVISLHPEQKYIVDQHGNRIEYNKLVWAGDMKLLYNIISLEELYDPKLKNKIIEKQNQLKDLKGGDSVFSIYATVNEKKEYFTKICTGHFFYTPSKEGLTSLSTTFIDKFIKDKRVDSTNSDVKNKIKEYLMEYCRLNTYEISIPVLRDENMAPEGKTGLIISILFDYQLTRKIDDLGWTIEMKEVIEQYMIKTLDESIFKGLKSKISEQFSSSPLTIEKLTRNTQGGITGWAFTNPMIPVENGMLSIAKSVDTILPSVFQAGQWVYSPSGMPISILTGKLASDKVLKMK